MARRAWPALCVTVLGAVLGVLPSPALAAPGDGPRVRELAGAAVHPWRLEIHKPPDEGLIHPDASPGLPVGLPAPGGTVVPAASPANGAQAVPRETSDRTFAELKALGISQARVDLLWCEIEPEASKPDWTVFDSVVASAARYGIELTPVVLCAPGWANGNGHYLAYPTDLAAFERFFATVLSRYPTIRAWEIWNEPNNEYFARPQPRVGPFVALLRAAHRARGSVGSQARLVSGGLAVSQSFGMFEFFEQMAAAGALDLIDGLGIHPYSVRAPDDPRSTFMRLRELRRRLVARGRRDISIWLTEYGVPDSTRRSGYGDAGGEERQAELLRRAYAIAARWPWIARLTWYEARDNCADPAEPECRLGLMRPDFAIKQAGFALRDLLAGGPFPRLATTTSARVSVVRPRVAGRTRRLRSPRARVYRVSGAVFRPIAGPVRRSLVVTVRRLPSPRQSRARAHRPLTRTAVLRAGAYSTALGRLRPGRYRVRVVFHGDAYQAGSAGERSFRVPGRAR
jgi:hypothetical protein